MPGRPEFRMLVSPEAYRLLDEGLLKQLYGDHNELHLTDRHLLNYLFRRQDHGGANRVTRLISWEEQSILFPFAAALFGMPSEVRSDPVPPGRIRALRG